MKNGRINDFALKNFDAKTTNQIPMESNQNGSLAIDSIIKYKIKLDANNNQINKKIKPDDNNCLVAQKLNNAWALR